MGPIPRGTARTPPPPHHTNPKSAASPSPALTHRKPQLTCGISDSAPLWVGTGKAASAKPVGSPSGGGAWGDPHVVLSVAQQPYWIPPISSSPFSVYPAAPLALKRGEWLIFSHPNSFRAQQRCTLSFHRANRNQAGQPHSLTPHTGTQLHLMRPSFVPCGNRKDAARLSTWDQGLPWPFTLAASVPGPLSSTAWFRVWLHVTAGSLLQSTLLSPSDTSHWLYFYLFIYLFFIFGCVGSSLLHPGCL